MTVSESKDSAVALPDYSEMDRSGCVWLTVFHYEDRPYEYGCPGHEVVGLYATFNEAVMACPKSNNKHKSIPHPDGTEPWFTYSFNDCNCEIYLLPCPPLASTVREAQHR